MTRYHVNPKNEVRRCSAETADACKFGHVAHFEGDADQARFMQETLDRARATAPIKPKPKVVDNFSFSSLSDPLYAREDSDGTYSIYLRFNGDSVLIEKGIAPIENRPSFVRHLGDVARTSGYAGHVVDTAWMREDPDVTQIREVSENPQGGGKVIGYLAKKSGGWIALRKLSELRSRPAASPGTGVVLAAYHLRREVAQVTALDEARDRGLARAQAIKDKVAAENPVVQAPSLRSNPKSLTTEAPHPYGRGSEL